MDKIHLPILNVQTFIEVNDHRCVEQLFLVLMVAKIADKLSFVLSMFNDPKMYIFITVILVFVLFLLTT